MHKKFFGSLRYDLSASVVLFFVAIPLCLGIAHASEAPLLAGLISGVIGGIVVGLISKAPLSVSGPAAGLTAITISGIKDLGSYESFALAILIAGLLQIGFGLLKSGFISKYIPHCVISGMLAAIGFILIFKQIPHLIGYDIEVMGVEEFTLTHQDLSDAATQIHIEEKNSITTFIHSLKHIHPIISIIGVSSLLVMFLWGKYIETKIKTIPGSIVIVILGTIASCIYTKLNPAHGFSQDHFVNIPCIDGIQSFLSLSKLPDWTQISNPKVFQVALSIAVIASIETLLSLEAIEKMDPLKRQYPGNRELLAQGVGNTVTGLLGGLPITSVIVRSSVNLSAGGKTQLSSILHGVLLLGGAVLASEYLNLIPLTTLAAVLIYTGYKLAKPEIFYKQYKLGLDQFIPSIITTISILFTDLLIGVALGLIVSLLFIIAKDYQSPVFTIEDHGTKQKMILSEGVHFLHKYKIVKFLEDIPPNTRLEIDASKTIFMDNDVEEAIKDFIQTTSSRNITIIYGGLVSRFNQRKKTMSENKKAYDKLIENNKQWVEEINKINPEYFAELSRGQTPEYLFIGCSDSRVPAENITKCSPGEMFVHRNIANLVVGTDINIMSVLQYAVEVLKVKHIILCGHYGCGGVKSAMDNQDLGLINQWLVNVKDVYRLHQEELDAIPDEHSRYRRLVELNAIEQSYNILKIPFIQKHKSLYSTPEVHAWAYDLDTGYINDLDIKQNIARQSDSIYKKY